MIILYEKLRGCLESIVPRKAAALSGRLVCRMDMLYGYAI
ncbi:hypothetical protein BRYFOR_06902 [Marvinbryantia formatexigens DSM 14469]|uniref:Uncharacterized protein n=1 Tax=Marvinbryantia formatexigens DSM 14469 TaxID=478749 RepID=C6LE53_9FIRM|nr:hypothetical protein BRYFOR_06902 [Marvinbryantia formatexigens DSM 14469]SDF71322.1 hypothetical protein SAMN05660368_01198 [Marvinbryantia formatexigens]